MTKPHLSDSSIGTYLDCGVRWEFRYVKGVKAPPGLALIRGKSGHAAAKANFAQKIDTQRDLPRRDLQEIAVAEFDRHLQADVLLSDEEQSIGWKNVTGDAKDALADSILVFAQQSAPEYQPIAGGVEKGFRLELPGSRDLIGFMDLVHTGGVVDFKFRSRKPRAKEADKSLQLVTYAAAYCSEYGELPGEVGIDTISSGRQTTRHLQTATVTTEDVDQLAAVINTVQKGIDAGVFLPAKSDWWGCSTKYCGYARMCPFFRGDR